MRAGQDQNTEDGEWHLDKRVPIAMILALAMHAGATLWWAASLSERVNVLERYQTTSAPQSDRLTRVEEKIESIKEGITEIKRLMRPTPPG